MAEFCPVAGLESLSREDPPTPIAMQQRTIEELKARVAQSERWSGRGFGNSNPPPSRDAPTPVRPERPTVGP
jgi:hypothetical protein